LHVLDCYDFTPSIDVMLQLFGFAYGGPFGHFLHKILDYIFKGKKDTKTIAKKVYCFSLTIFMIPFIIVQATY
jgi:hypothetical protein